MRRKAIYTLIGLSLLAFGWVAGRAAKTPPPDFTLEIEGPPDGRIAVKCVRGCVLQGGRDEAVPGAGRILEYSVECSGVQRCSGTANGWLKNLNADRTLKDHAIF
jgi:hypothetical protein